MARLPRIDIAGVPTHVIQRGNNRTACFFAEADYGYYLEFLSKAAKKCACAVHAYVLMTNHVHLLLTPSDVGAVANVMQSLGRNYVKYVNAAYKRTGTLWEGRYKSSLIDSERYLLACYRYIEQNPVRAGMVKQADDYRWSSYRVHVQGLPSDLIVDHPVYTALGKDGKERAEAYRRLVENHTESADDIQHIRSETNRGGVAGSDRFKDEIESALSRRVRPGQSGRPNKKQEK
jgi:putative transposase